MKKTFVCTLAGAGPKRAFPYIEELPFDSAEVFGTKGRVPVKVTIEGVSLTTSLAPMGGRHVLAFSKANAEELGIAVGDRVRVTMEKDDAERAVDIPPELAKVLKGAAKKAWDALAYSHRKEHARAIAGAKQPETRARRVAKTLAMLTTTGRPPRPKPSAKPLASRLHLKPGMKVAVLAAPKGFLLGVPTTPSLSPLPDVTLVFLSNRAALATWLPRLTALAASALWLAYPKTTSGVKTDLTRDAGWDAVEQLGLSPHMQVSVDDTWSALRFSPRSPATPAARRRASRSE